MSDRECAASRRRAHRAAARRRAARIRRAAPARRPGRPPTNSLIRRVLPIPASPPTITAVGRPPRRAPTRPAAGRALRPADHERAGHASAHDSLFAACRPGPESATRLPTRPHRARIGRSSDVAARPSHVPSRRTGSDEGATLSSAGHAGDHRMAGRASRRSEPADRRGRRGHRGLPPGPRAQRGGGQLDHRPAGSDPPRLRLAEAFAALQDRLGITNSTTVVLYGGNNNWFAAYAYWYYKVYGHGDVRLVDGGRKAWELEGRKLVTEAPGVARHHRLPAGAARSDHPRLPRPGARRLRRQPGAGAGRRALARGVPRREAGPRPPAQRGRAAPGPHSRRRQHPVGQGRRPRDGPVPARRPASHAVRRSRASPPTATSWRTAGSANGPRTPGSSCTSCSATRTCATTTDRGPSGARWSACRSRNDSRCWDRGPSGRRKGRVCG